MRLPNFSWQFILSLLVPSTVIAQCVGDFDGNGVVNVADRGHISANLGCDTSEPACAIYDLDHNGVVNPADRGYISANLGVCPQVVSECGSFLEKPRDTLFCDDSYGDMILYKALVLPGSLGETCSDYVLAVGETVYDDALAVYNIGNRNHPRLASVSISEEDDWDHSFHFSSISYQQQPDGTRLAALAGSFDYTQSPRVAFVSLNDPDHPEVVTVQSFPAIFGSDSGVNPWYGRLAGASGGFVAPGIYVAVINRKGLEPAAAVALRIEDNQTISLGAISEIPSATFIEGIDQQETDNHAINCAGRDSELFCAGLKTIVHISYDNKNQQLTSERTAVIPQMTYAKGQWGSSSVTMPAGMAAMMGNSLVVIEDNLYLARSLFTTSPNTDMTTEGGVYFFKIPAGETPQFQNFYPMGLAQPNSTFLNSSLISTVRNGTTYLHAFVPGRKFVNNNWRWSVRDMVYTVTQTGDLITNPAPFAHGFIPDGEDHYRYARFAANNRLYTVSGGYGLMYDYSDPLHPQLLPEYDANPQEPNNRLVYSGIVIECQRTLSTHPSSSYFPYPFGDVNCDSYYMNNWSTYERRVNEDDVAPFFFALSTPHLYEFVYPYCWIGLADVNRDGMVDDSDVQPFLDLIGQ